MFVAVFVLDEAKHYRTLFDLQCMGMLLVDNKRTCETKLN